MKKFVFNIRLLFLLTMLITISFSSHAEQDPVNCPQECFSAGYNGGFLISSIQPCTSPNIVHPSETSCCCFPNSCDQICQMAEKGYKAGMTLPDPACPQLAPASSPVPDASAFISSTLISHPGVCGTVTEVPNCSERGIVDNCCCEPCGDDLECLCKYGNLNQIKCAANKHSGQCCANAVTSTTVNIPNPPITCQKAHLTYSGGQACGLTTGCASIAIALCPSDCGEICDTLDHEMGHWYDCYVSMLGSGCDGLLEHVRVNFGAYNECINSPCMLNCDINWLKDSCTKYCTTCPTSNEVQQICDKASQLSGTIVYPETCRNCSAMGSNNSECSLADCSYDSTNNRCVNCSMGGNFCNPFLPNGPNSQCQSGYTCGAIDPVLMIGCCE